ncbi:MAG: acyltransferase [Bdellovibrionaceae bacterium]|nr:acyltransferase [Pseudobdellovibrionaceae bacterium]
MIRKAQKVLVGALSLFFLCVNTIVCFVAIFPFALLKALVPLQAIRAFATKQVVVLGQAWIGVNSYFLSLLGLLCLRLEGDVPQNLETSYLVWSNHQSWVDIMVLQNALNRRIPFLRFFIKSELFWVPLMGIAWWALDFPFMKRYTKEEIAKDPRKKGADLKTTQEACEKFRGLNISILNFLEGTRFTPEKRDALASPYKNLLPPKSGGVAAVLSAMGSQFHSLVDVTIFYPKGPRSFLSLLSGGVGEVLVHVDMVPIPSHLARTKAEGEDADWKEVQEWIRSRWAQKDELLSRMKEQALVK